MERKNGTSIIIRLTGIFKETWEVHLDAAPSA
jgi:hypothetical protein